MAISNRKKIPIEKNLTEILIFIFSESDNQLPCFKFLPNYQMLLEEIIYTHVLEIE